jgi:acetoin utilization deacetylase AcuC-like enzyme
MKVFYTDTFDFPFPSGHRFPVRKYPLLRQRIMEAKLIPVEDLIIPQAATDEQILRVHTFDYHARVTEGHLSTKEVRRIGLPWSNALVERARRSVGGTIAACRAALVDGMAINLGGGTHHAHPDFGAGYCIFNDAAIAARTTQAESLARRVVILDCDVHQGDGTAAIFAVDPTVFTFSIHCDGNYPSHKGKSDLDIALPNGTSDEAYLETLIEGVERALAAAEADLAIYLAGADPYRGDTFGRLSLSKVGLAKRDRIIFEACQTTGLPVAIVMSGGYARHIEDVVDIHFQTVQLAVEAAKHYHR